MISQPFGYSALIIGERDLICCFLHFRDRVGHRDPGAAKPQHFNIIQVITEGNGILRTDSADLSQGSDCCRFSEKRK